MKTYQVDKNGFYGNFGGAYIPEILYQCVEQLKDNYRKVLDSDDFRQEFHSLLRDYVAVLLPSICQTPLGTLRMPHLSEAGRPES